MFDEKLKNDVNFHIIVGGDFNDFCIRPLCEQFNFVNKVSSPTRLNSVLDLILIDEDLSTLYADSAVVGPPIKNSDHNSVLLLPLENVKHVLPSSQIPFWDFRESFLLDFRYRLQMTDFSILNLCHTIEDMIAEFYRLFSFCASAIPCNIISVSCKDKPWITLVLKVLINKRWQAFRSKNWHLYNHYKLKVKNQIKVSKSIWAKQQCRSVKGMWNAVKEVSGKLNHIP